MSYNPVDGVGLNDITSESVSVKSKLAGEGISESLNECFLGLCIIAQFYLFQGGVHQVHS